MADLDASIYARQTPPANPLQMLGPAEQVNKLSLFPLVQRQAEAATKGSELDLAGKGLSFVRQMIATRAADPNVTKRDLIDDLTTLSRQPGMESIPTSHFVQQINKLPENNPKAIADYITRQQIGEIGPSGAAGERVIGVRPEGQPVQGTVAQGLRRASGLDQPGAPEPAAAPPAAMPGTAPGAPPARTAAPAASAAAPGVPLQQGYVTSLPPGSAKSIDTMQEHLIRAGNYGQEIAPWTQALSAINELKDRYGKGYFAPGSKGRQDFQSYFYGISPTLSRWLGVDEGKLKNYAEADKYLTQAVQARASSFGAHTDQQLATTISGSPNVHVNDLAVDDVVKMSIALRRMEQAQTLQNAKLGGAEYTKNSAGWATKQDPRAYAIDLLDGDQLAKLKKSLPAGSAQREKFNASLDEAIRAGVIADPRRSQPAAQ